MEREHGAVGSNDRAEGIRDGPREAFEALLEGDRPHREALRARLCGGLGVGDHAADDAAAAGFGGDERGKDGASLEAVDIAGVDAFQEGDDEVVEYPFAEVAGDEVGDGFGAWRGG